MKLFSNSTFMVLEQALNNASLRQKTISQNVANVDTPNYKSKQVIFKNHLNEAMNAHRTDERHFQFSSSNKGGPVIKTMNNTFVNHNGNNVDIDYEMAEMAKNQIYYNALIDRMNGRFSSLKTVLGGK
ncbi:flagellar basal body rod protein FlgB [Anaerobacillus sp. MEB173]|uniref:flagellar basal body rod protein FlgB n=1 Tax=Anaerobacillus sp. MEB173 TaxID=3383345 RepID=UPI003F8F0AF2